MAAARRDTFATSSLIELSLKPNLWCNLSNELLASLPLDTSAGRRFDIFTECKI
jgi:hypothetical protein